MSKDLIIQSKDIYQIKIKGEVIPVMLDKDLAKLYGVEPRVLNQAVKRNKDKFKGIFFKLTPAQHKSVMESQGLVYRGGQQPQAFTEEGALMISAVLNSKRAIEVLKILIKSFFIVKQIIHENPNLDMMELTDLKDKILKMEKRIAILESKPLVGTVNNYGQLQLGNHNHQDIKVNSFEDAIKMLKQLSKESESTSEIKKITSEAIIVAKEKDKKGLIEQTEKLSSLANNTVDVGIKLAPYISALRLFLGI